MIFVFELVHISFMDVIVSFFFTSNNNSRSCRRPCVVLIISISCLSGKLFLFFSGRKYLRPWLCDLGVELNCMLYGFTWAKGGQ